MLVQCLSSRKLLQLKLAVSGSDLLLLGVTLLAFYEQLTCHLKEIRSGNCPASGLFVQGSFCKSCAVRGLSQRYWLPQEHVHAVWRRRLSPEKDLHINPHEIGHHLLLQGAEGLFLQEEEGTADRVGEMLFLLDSHVHFQLNSCLIYFHRNQQREHVSCCYC